MGDKSQKNKSKNRKQKAAKNEAQLKKKPERQEQSSVPDLLKR